MAQFLLSKIYRSNELYTHFSLLIYLFLFLSFFFFIVDAIFIWKIYVLFVAIHDQRKCPGRRCKLNWLPLVFLVVADAVCGTSLSAWRINQTTPFWGGGGRGWIKKCIRKMNQWYMSSGICQYYQSGIINWSLPLFVRKRSIYLSLWQSDSTKGKQGHSGQSTVRGGWRGSGG